MLRALTIAAIGGVVLPSNGSACKERRLELRYESAERVFTARILKTELRTEVLPSSEEHYGSVVIEATFHPLEILKGTPPSNNTLTTRSQGTYSCFPPLTVGEYYVAFIDRDGAASTIGPFQQPPNYQAEVEYQNHIHGEQLKQLEALKSK